MKNILLTALLLLTAVCQITADEVLPSVTPPTGDGRPEHVYEMISGNGIYCSSSCVPTKKADNYGLFAFYPVEGKGADVFYIYSYKAKKWLTYAPAGSYRPQNGFIRLEEQQNPNCYFRVHAYDSNNYEIQPYTTTGNVSYYLNWFKGIDFNPYDGTVTLGLWSENGQQDGGSRWIFSEVVIKTYKYTLTAPAQAVVTIHGKQYRNGDVIKSEGNLKQSDIKVSSLVGNFPLVVVDDEHETINVRYIADIPSTATKGRYTNAVLYPAQQTEVGTALLTESKRKNEVIYSFGNNVLDASFVLSEQNLIFAGSKAMNLEPGTEPFTLAFGNGVSVPASAMTLKGVSIENLQAEPNAVGGVEHFAGKALVAEYSYTYKGKAIKVVWRAILRDGSHYLRTEMELTGVDDVDMYHIMALDYRVNAVEAGSKPAVVGNTRGAVIVSNKIFAGLENPVGYNTVGDTVSDENSWTLSKTLDEVSLTSADWHKVEQKEVPNRFTEVTGKGYPNVYQHTEENISLVKNQKVEVTVSYKSGNHRLNFGGAELFLNGFSAANDFHSGFSGNAHKDNTFSMIAPYTGNFSIRVYVDNTESIDASSNWVVKVYNPKSNAVVNNDIVPIRGRWSRHTTLKKGDTWKISAVVGLIAQDGTEDEANINKSQKRRSFLAYSERERAVPWRPFPAYISWYELNINRNNAPTPTNNMNAEQVLDVEHQWMKNCFSRYGVGPRAFVIDDGWDNYGTWTFHTGFPNEMRDIADYAKDMKAGVGAWLGPVGGYGASGDYRRNYWRNKGGMQLSNPDYYKVYLDAARNLTKNNGDFCFFKFDGISAQFSATGPDEGDRGNENAEGIIRLEQYVRENLRRDIFFNTTVGTWASPFWYHITDATWRQENDYGTAGNNRIDRENWITYRDHLVYQNYVTRSPLCPINTLMTHGFILSSFGNVSKNMDYEAVRRELRCAFVCGSGMVELYNDYALMNSIRHGQLWSDLAECIKWQKRQADVLPDAHWVGGDPWDGSKANVYGWAAWNGKKATLALRNGANEQRQYSFTLREALNIPKTVPAGTAITLRKSFCEQDVLEGLVEGRPIAIDEVLTVILPASSLYAFDGVQGTPVDVKTLTLSGERGLTTVVMGNTLVVNAEVLPADASFHALTWTSSAPAIATVSGGLVKALTPGVVTISAVSVDGKVVGSMEVTVVEKPFEPYAVNFDKDAKGTNRGRKINKILWTVQGMDEQSVTVENYQPYIDKTESILTCPANSQVTVEFNINGAWMNGYVYIDKDNDKVFSFKPNSLDQSETDVMTYSFYSGNFEDDSVGQNSSGKEISGANRNTMACPSFNVNLTPGTYRIRFKMDWNSIDPGGQVGSDGTLTQHNAFFDTGGSIVDVTLKVEAVSSGISEIQNQSSQSEKIFDVSGRRLYNVPSKGIYIRNGKVVVK